MRHVFERVVDLPVSGAEAFAWHDRPGAFERLSPPWQRIDVAHRSGSIRDGDTVTLKLRFGPVPITWQLVHRDYIPGVQFRDEQVVGPFRSWRHTHRFEPLDATRSRLVDRIEYELPAAASFMSGHIQRQLTHLFAFRHKLTRDDLALHAAFAHRPRLTVAITGATGLVGRQLSALLTTGGHRVLKLVRRPSQSPDAIAWDPARGVLEPAKLEGVDAVVHLAGESVAGLWTAVKRKRIRDSRAIGTRSLAESLAKLTAKPKALICASAVGFYGSRGDEALDETSTSGEGFLPATCREWEAAADPARAASIRTAHLRLGIVLTPAGGALKAMLTPFSLGLGGVLGPGTQWLPWIGLDDVVSAFYWALMNEQVAGPVNVTSPNPVTNREFTKTLGRVLHRPTFAAVPEALLNLAGDMGREMLLTSQRVMPTRLTREAFPFRDTQLEPMLTRVLGRGD